MSSDESKTTLDDQLDKLVAKYTDEVEAGRTPRHDKYLSQVPNTARPGLERCLKMIDAGIASAPSAARPLTPGDRMGQYTLRREIGRGGMALVWLAEDPELARPVALKLLRPGLALEQIHVDRFKREALAIARLKHPNVVQIFSVGEAQGYHYIAMEYVEGPSLATVLGALPLDRNWSADELALASGIRDLAGAPNFEQAFCRLLAPIADALQAAHDLGLVHRDVKPSNILLHRDGRAVVADFGLAKGDSDPGLSMTGDTIGTPHYMSPEQAQVSEANVDHRTDIYSLGVTLYEALAGRRPFEGRTVLEVFEAIKTQAAAPMHSKTLRASRDSELVVHMAMARRPEDRYGKASDFAEDLRALGQGQPTRARAERPGLLARFTTTVLWLMSNQPYEYRSQRTFLGLPLVHITRGHSAYSRGPKIAKGWLAMGDIAIGGLAIGGFTAGLLCFGGVGFSLLFTFAGIALGLGIGFGGIAAAPIAIGGIAVGLFAFGGLAWAYTAIGGMSWGEYTYGGSPRGTYRIGDGFHDQEAVDHMRELAPWILRLVGIEE